MSWCAGAIDNIYIVFSWKNNLTNSMEFSSSSLKLVWFSSLLIYEVLYESNKYTIHAKDPLFPITFPTTCTNLLHRKWKRKFCQSNIFYEFLLTWLVLLVFYSYNWSKNLRNLILLISQRLGPPYCNNTIQFMLEGN